jgi:hypothetical protein
VVLRLPEARAISAAAENIAHSLVASYTDSVVGNVFQHGKARAGDKERRLYFTEFTQWCSEVQDRPRSYFDSMALQASLPW